MREISIKRLGDLVQGSTLLYETASVIFEKDFLYDGKVFASAK